MGNSLLQVCAIQANLIVGAVGIAVAAAVGATARAFGLDWTRSLIGAICFGCVAGLATADFTPNGPGPWWADRPMAGAAITGLLLMAITVLVVEALVARLDARRWERAAETALKTILDAADERTPPGYERATNTLWRIRELLQAMPHTGAPPRRLWDGDIRQKDWPSYWYGAPFDDLSDEAEIARAHLHAAVMSVAPLLTATDELHGLFDTALSAVQGLSQVSERSRAYGAALWAQKDKEGVDIDDSSIEEPGYWGKLFPDARGRWIGVLRGAEQLFGGLDDLEREAKSRYHLQLREDPPWRPPQIP